MAFYVPLGPRGLLFRLGTFVIGIWGGLVYRLASRRRAIMMPCPAPFPSRGMEPSYTQVSMWLTRFRAGWCRGCFSPRAKGRPWLEVARLEKFPAPAFKPATKDAGPTHIS